MVETMLIILTIVIVILSGLLITNIILIQRQRKTETSSKPLYQGETKDSIIEPTVPPNNDKDIVEMLALREAEDKLSAEQQEVIKMMVGNREHSQYKKALSKTIAEIKHGIVIKKEGENING